MKFGQQFEINTMFVINLKFEPIFFRYWQIFKRQNTLTPCGPPTRPPKFCFFERTIFLKSIDIEKTNILTNRRLRMEVPRPQETIFNELPEVHVDFPVGFH